MGGIGVAEAATWPSSDINLYSESVLAGPFATYRALRDLGSAVYLKQFDAWFIGRFKDDSSALGDCADGTDCCFHSLGQPHCRI